MSPWVNFKKLRESLDFAQVLRDYDVAVTMKGDQAMGFCPLPDHKGRTDRKSKSFSVNLKKGIFQCFGCQAKGNVLDFVALMEGLDPDNPKEFRKVALMLQERYSADGVGVAPDRPESREPESASDDNARRLVNAPLGFELKGLRTDHPYPYERGLSVETAEYFGLGFCEKGHGGIVSINGKTRKMHFTGRLRFLCQDNSGRKCYAAQSTSYLDTCPPVVCSNNPSC